MKTLEKPVRPSKGIGFQIVEMKKHGKILE
jgi:hypothetical protein